VPDGVELLRSGGSQDLKDRPGFATPVSPTSFLLHTWNGILFFFADKSGEILFKAFLK
jgi:hypothetical protein